jgi:hypothetical protein
MNKEQIAEAIRRVSKIRYESGGIEGERMDPLVRTDIEMAEAQAVAVMALIEQAPTIESNKRREIIGSNDYDERTSVVLGVWHNDSTASAELTLDPGTYALVRLEQP